MKTQIFSTVLIPIMQSLNLTKQAAEFWVLVTLKDVPLALF